MTSSLPEISTLVILLRLLPLMMLFGTFIGYLAPEPKIERYVTIIVRIFTASYLLSSFTLLMSYICFHTSEPYLYGDFNIHGFISSRYFIDLFSCTFLFVSSIIAFITLFFAGRMLHREPGFSRFFIGSSILLFGMTLILTSRDFDILFAGWEFLGMSSFIMIGFYRDRIVAAKHALRAMTYFRISDLGLLVGVFIVHSFGEGFEDFVFLKQHFTMSLLSTDHFFWLSFFLLVSATGKSAQFPFSHWLPRAMEGPSNSSAIFYGAISVHMGVFLLLRTSNIWQKNTYFLIALFAIGFFSSVHAFIVSFFQTNIKSKIAWNSIGHLGLMFVELSFNLELLCMCHVIFNAISKSIQYLTASSALILEARLVRFHRKKVLRLNPTIKKFLSAAQNEFYFDFWFKFLIARPYLQMSKSWENLNAKYNTFLLARIFTSFSFLISICILVLGVLIDPYAPDFHNLLPKDFTIAGTILGLGLVFVIYSVLNFRNPINFYSTSHLATFLVSASILFIGDHESIQAFLAFNFGLSFGYILIQICTLYIFYHNNLEKDPGNGFYGLGESKPWLASVLFLGAMITICMPITSSFFGEDFLLELGHKNFESPVFIAGLGIFALQITSIFSIAKIYFGYKNKSASKIKDLSIHIVIPLFGVFIVFCIYSFWKFKLLIH